MTDEERNAIVLYRMENARRTLNEIADHCERGYWNTAINRMYYACFHTVFVLLIKMVLFRLVDSSSIIKAYIKIPGRYRPGILFGCKVEIYLILLYPYTAKSPNSSSMRSN